MARTKQIQRPAIPRSVSTRGKKPLPIKAIALLTTSVLAAVWALGMLTETGKVWYLYTFVYVEYYIGVVSLVSLSITVMAGVVATDRLVLMIRHRVLLQSAHRATGIIAVTALFIHIIVKISTGRAAVLDPFVPFVSGRGLAVGMGTIAGWLMVLVLWSGIFRARFLSTGKPWMWRAVHSMTYVSWPIGLLHGLTAGRPAATWVNASYLMCLVAVIFVLLARLSVSLGRKQREQALNTVAVAKPASKAQDDDARTLSFGSGSAKRRSSGGRDELRVGRDLEDTFSPRLSSGATETAVIDSWAPPGEVRTESPRRRTNRFAVPEVPVAKRDTAESESEARARRRVVTEERRADERRADERRADERRASDDRRLDDRRFDDRDLDDRDLDDRDLDERPAARERSRSRRRPPAEQPREETRPETRRRGADADQDRDDLLQGYRRTSRAWTGDEDDRPSVDDLLEGYRKTARAWTEEEPVSAAPVSPRSRFAGRYGVDDEEDLRDTRPAARYAPEEPPVDDTPTLVDLASRRARRAAGDGGRDRSGSTPRRDAEQSTSTSRAGRRKRATAEEIEEGAYWTRLREEAN